MGRQNGFILDVELEMQWHYSSEVDDNVRYSNDDFPMAELWTRMRNRSYAWWDWDWHSVIVISESEFLISVSCRNDMVHFRRR